MSERAYMTLPNDDRTDRELVAAANQGDRAAFETLYYRYRDWVCALAFRFSGDRDASWDIVQETFLYFFGKFPGLDLRCQIRTLLYPAVKHLALTRRRKEARTEPLAEQAEQLPAPAIREEHAERERLLDLVRALPEAQREVVLLRFADGLELSEIAQALGVPLGTVKSRLHNALGALRVSLE